MRNKKIQQQHASTIRFFVGLGDFILVNALFLAVMYLYKPETISYIGLKYHMVLVNMAYAISLFSTGIILDRRIVNSENIVALVFKTAAIFGGILIASTTILSNAMFSPIYWAIYIVGVF